MIQGGIIGKTRIHKDKSTKENISELDMKCNRNGDKVNNVKIRNGAENHEINTTCTCKHMCGALMRTDVNSDSSDRADLEITIIITG